MITRLTCGSGWARLSFAMDFSHFGGNKPAAIFACCLTFGLSGLSFQANAANWLFYSNSSAFNATLDSSFTETFASLPSTDAEVQSPTNFSGNGFAFSAVTTSNKVDSSLYSIGPTASDRWLTLLWADDSIVLTNLDANIRAVGGNFFGTAQNGSTLPATLTLVASFLDATTFTTNVPASGSDTFYGLTFDSQLTSLSIGADPAYATIDNVTMGTVIPEPGTGALLILAALMFFLGAARIKRTSRQK